MSKGFKRNTTVRIIVHEVKSGQWKELGYQKDWSWLWVYSVFSLLMGNKKVEDVLIKLAIDTSLGGVGNTKEDQKKKKKEYKKT